MSLETLHYFYFWKTFAASCLSVVSDTPRWETSYERMKGGFIINARAVERGREGGRRKGRDEYK